MLKWRSVSYIMSVLYMLCSRADGAAQCTWPTQFQNSVWQDNEKGTLTFTADQMTGYSFVSLSTTIETWECYSGAQWTSDGHIVMKATETVPFSGSVNTFYLCMKLTKVSDYSYYYYQAAGKITNAAGQRVYVSPDASPALSAICNDASGAAGSEFSVLVKSGSEDQATITCPTLILGRFDYSFTDAGGTDYCTDPTHMDVCSDKTKFSFLKTCSKSIAYADGAVNCIVSKEVGGNTYLVTYNPQTSAPDNTNTYRFACFALSSDGTKATVVYNNCRDIMTPDVLPELSDGTKIGGKIVFSPYVRCQGGCNWPAVFASSTWLDNTRGSIVWAATTVTGWSFNAFSTDVTNWECLSMADFDADGILLIKATDTFEFSSQTMVSYMCLQFSKITDTSYSYYQLNDQILNAANERVVITAGDTLTTRAEICKQTDTSGFKAEFHYIVKSGSESASKQYCPPSLLAKFDYTYTASDGTTTACGDTTDDWDVCTDRQIMTYDYTTCTQKMAYSDTGVVWCMMNITSTYEYVVVYNTDPSPDGSTFYKFSCFAISTDGTTASMVYNNCTINMSPTTRALTHAGAFIGSTITMTAKETCPFLGPTTAASVTTAPESGGSTSGGGESSSLIPIIVGAVVGVLVLAIVIGVTVYCIKRKNANVAPEKPPVPDGVVTPIQPEVEDLTVPGPSPVNPAITAEPNSNRLPPLPVNNASPRGGAPTLPPIHNGHLPS